MRRVYKILIISVLWIVFEGAMSQDLQTDKGKVHFSNNCLPIVLFAESANKETISKVAENINAERNRDRSYSKAETNFLGSLAVAARRVSDALALSGQKEPELLLVRGESSYIVDRRYSGSSREAIMLSEDDALSVIGEGRYERFLFAILAHEFGHAFQFSQSLDHSNQELFQQNGHLRSVRQLELHADFLAGFALARAEAQYGKSDQLLQRFSDTILSMGDTLLAPCLHHGTPAERYLMMMKGYIEAQKDPSLSAADASKAGMDLLDSGALGPGIGDLVRFDQSCG